MLKGKYALLSLAAALVCWQAVSVNNASSGIVDPCKSVVTAAAGTVLVCPQGDGNALTGPIGGGNSQVSLTVKDNTGAAVPGIPFTDMWLVGCNDGLLLCGGSQGSNADAATDGTGHTTFSAEPVAGGCDTGLYAVVQGVVIQDTGTCLPKCLPIATHSPDYKSDAGCGAIDNPCPDSKVDNSDFSWFAFHYPYPGHPATFFACADLAAPLGGVIDLSDFSAFAVHFVGSGHKCPI